MTPDEQREADECRTFLIDNLPRLWWGLYSGMIEQGFDASQSMYLLTEYLHATNDFDEYED